MISEQYGNIYVQRVSAAGVPLWNADGVPVCTVPAFKFSPQLVSDGAGGAIVAWEDFRSGPTTDIYVQRVNAVGIPQWTANGIAPWAVAGDQSYPQLATDGSGGAIVAWTDYRGTDSDIYAGRVDAAGIPQGTAGGVEVCAATGYQDGAQLVSDGAGGAIVTWRDSRGADGDIYARRVDAAGTPQWTADGVALCVAGGDQSSPQLVIDGSGGAIVAWEDHRSGSANVYARQVDAAGAPQWTANGVLLCTAGFDQSNPQLVADGSGGAVVAWNDTRSGLSPDIYAQRVNAAGLLQWGVSGVAVCTAANLQFSHQLVADGAGGAIVAWEDERGSPYSDIIDIYARRVDAAGTPQWTANGVAMCTAIGQQRSPMIVADGSGGAIVTWYDERSATDFDIYGQRVSAGGAPQWATDGVAVQLDPGVQRYPATCPDGSGGVLIAWQEKRAGSYDIYLRRFDAAGIPLWPAVPVCVSPNSQLFPALAPDGAGGAFVAWNDNRGGSDWKTYAQRVDATGNAHWIPNGMELCLAADRDRSPQLVPDGSGGAIIAWMESRGVTGLDIYAQRVTAAGVLQWTPSGVTLCTAVDQQLYPWLVSDGAGGAIVAWEDNRTPVTGSDIYARWVDATGAPHWTPDGVAVCTEASRQSDPQVVSDGAGGAIVGWQDQRFGTDPYVQRVNAAGVPQWTADGVALSSIGWGSGAQLISDGAGGVIAAWADYRSGTDYDVYARRVDAGGVPQWTPDGVAVCTAGDQQFGQSLVSDGAGGAIIAWLDHRGSDFDIYARGVNAAGVPQWTADGVAVCTAIGLQGAPRIVSDGAGGALLAWSDRRIGRDYILGQRVTAGGTLAWTGDGVTPVLVSLVSAEARTDRVRLTWYAANAAELRTVVQRSTGGGWTMLGSPITDGTGRFTYEDRTVVPGERYGYRLGWSEAGGEQFTAETWVDVPRAIEFALLGARPSPAVSDLWVWFSLPSDAPATLRLFDLAGRQVRERAVAGAGTRAVNLAEGDRLPAGMYVVQLTQGARSLSRRVAVMR